MAIRQAHEERKLRFAIAGESAASADGRGWQASWRNRRTHPLGERVAEWKRSQSLESASSASSAVLSIPLFRVNSRRLSGGPALGFFRARFVAAEDRRVSAEKPKRAWAGEWLWHLIGGRSVS